jgi:hypothetical protein
MELPIHELLCYMFEVIEQLEAEEKAAEESAKRR